MDASLMLCDSAQVSEAKFYILGGGWQFTSPINPQMAIAVEISVDRDNTGRKHTFKLVLQDENGKNIEVEKEGSLKPVSISGEFEAKMPDDHPHEIPVSVKLAVNIKAPPLNPNSRYRWVLFIDDNQEAQVTFNTRA